MDDDQRYLACTKLIDLQAGRFNGEYYAMIIFGIIWILVLLAFMAVLFLGEWIWALLRGKK